MRDRSDLDARHSLLPPAAGVPPSASGPDTRRLVAGAVTWLLLVLTVRRAERPAVARLGGAVLLMAGLIWTEWAALMTADHRARDTVAASRGYDVPHLGVAGPMESSLIGVLLFFVGMKLIGREQGGIAPIWETIAVALICPAVALLVGLNVLPLTA